jgi:hypothetical protein
MEQLLVYTDDNNSLDGTIDTINTINRRRTSLVKGSVAWTRVQKKLIRLIMFVFLQ